MFISSKILYFCFTFDQFCSMIRIVGLLPVLSLIFSYCVDDKLDAEIKFATLPMSDATKDSTFSTEPSKPGQTVL